MLYVGGEKVHGESDEQTPTSEDQVAVEARTLTMDRDQTTPTVLVEVLPDVAVALGEIPDALEAHLIDFGVVPEGDIESISAALTGVVGNSASIVGNLSHGLTGVKGLYRVNAATQALLDKGAVLAAKDGAKLGSVWLDGKLVAQARFVPLTAMSAAQMAAAIGPAIAMIGLQMQLHQITGLVNTNIALTSQVLSQIRHEQWAELTGLVTTITGALNRAREIGSVPSSLWDSIAGNESALAKQRDLYRLNVNRHIKQIDQLDSRARREYLENNAEALRVIQNDSR